jgi:protein-tyrosine phosphatase
MILSLFKSKKESVVSLKVDLHSHIISGIDDGAKEMQESLTFLEGLEALGYQKIITTPHIMKDTYPNTRDDIINGLNLLRAAAKDAGITLQIEAAAEYYIDEGFEELIVSNDFLTIEKSYLLCETSYYAKPLNLEAVIFKVTALGYKMILAHPERYRYIDIKSMESEYKRLKSLGVYFQVNSNSFGGHYGKEAKTKANFLSSAGMIDFLGSDIHRLKQLETLKQLQDTKAYQAVFKHNTILNDTLL